MKTVWEVCWGVALGLATILVLKACVATVGAEPDVSTPDAIGILMGQVITPDVSKFPAYDTLEEAAVHAAERLYKCSQVYECSSVIVKRTSDGKYINGPARSDYSGDSVQVNTSHPVGSTMVASVHSHPCNPDAHYVSFFSPEDLISDISRRQIGIMVDFCTGDVHEFDPSRDVAAAEELENDPGTYSTHGRIVGHIEVSKETVEPHVGF